MNWNGHAAITPNGDRSFTIHVDEHWVALEGVHGGIVAALMVDAVEAVLRDEVIGAGTTLRAATFGYVSANDIGESTVDVDATHWTLAPGEFSVARMHTFHSHDGFAVEDGRIHHPDGTLLATVRQTRLAG